MSMLALRQVSKVYGQGAGEVHALTWASLSVDPGAMAAVVGPAAGRDARAPLVTPGQAP